MLTQSATVTKDGTVRYNPQTCAIECAGCGQATPLSRSTLRNPHRFTEEMQMARELHEDCVGLNSAHANLRRKWREGFLRHKYATGGERLAYSV